jgi:ferredoxin
MAEGKKIAKIVVDRDLCIAAASCISAAGEVFELDGENKAVIKLKSGEKNSGPAMRADLEAADISDEQLIAAAESCPTAAIFLYDEEGNQVYPA